MLFFDHQRRAATLPGDLREASIAPAQAEIAAYLQLSENVRLQTDLPARWKSVGVTGDNVINALQGLSHQRCAFCDSNRTRLQVYRFRPPGYAAPIGGPGDKSAYIWLALNWGNMFPICEGCIPDNPEYFPVEDGRRAPAPEIDSDGRLPESDIRSLDEEAILLFPGELSPPWSVFDVELSGVLVGKGARAKLTIKHFKLNRPALVEARRKLFKEHLSDLRRGKLNDVNFAQTRLGGPLYLLYRKFVRTALSLAKSDQGLDPERILGTLRDWMQLDSSRAEADAAIALLEAGWKPAKEKRTRVPPMPAREVPQLRSVTIENYKSIERLSFSLAQSGPPGLLDHDAEPTPCMLIIGENAAGKSSILEAIALGCLSQPHVDALKLTPADLLLDPELMGSPKAGRPSRSTITLNFGEQGERTATIDGLADQVMADQGTSVPPPLVFAYGARRLYERTERPQLIRHVDTLFDFSKYLSNPERWLIKMADERPLALGEVVSALRHVIEIDGTFEDIEVRKDAKGIDRCFIRIRRPLDDDDDFILEQRLDVASSGYRAVLALICDVFAGLIDAARAAAGGRPPDVELQRIVREARQMKAIVLIDEVEAHMHPRWKLNVLRGLRRALPGVTFIVTSHDPLCVRGMGQGEIMLVNRYINQKKEGLREAVEQTTDFEDATEMTVEQLLTSQLFQLLSTDDIRMDRHLSELSSILSHRDDRGKLSEEQNAVLSAFEADITSALPFGRSEATRFVQDTVAKYLAQRRTRRGSEVTKAREDAEAEINRFLSGLLT